MRRIVGAFAEEIDVRIEVFPEHPGNTGEREA